jgi:hypothetical protein
MDMEHIMRKGNLRSLIAEGNYSLGKKAREAENDGCDVRRSRPGIVRRHEWNLMMDGPVVVLIHGLRRDGYRRGNQSDT